MIRLEKAYLCPGDGDAHITDNSSQCECGNTNLTPLASILNREEEPVVRKQTSGPRCVKCGNFTTYKRVNTHGLCMKCEREVRAATKTLLYI